MINWAKPDYSGVYQERETALARLQENPGSITSLNEYYKDHWVEFINSWAMTYDPRKIPLGENPIMPLVLFPKQVEFVNWVYERFMARERGLVEKSRDMGVSWLACWCAICIWKFFANSNVGFGSRKKESVDNGEDDPDSLFWKIRKGIEFLPKEFIPKGFGEGNKWALVVNPENGSTIKGEIGDSIGMGGRCVVYFVDEADALEHQLLAEASLSATTDCRVDLSTANQVGSVFYNNRRSLPERQVFVFDWTDDPRKRLNPNLAPSEEPWYLKQKRELQATTIASQIDRNPAGAVANTFIPVPLIEDAEQRPVSLVEQAPSVPWLVGVDASGMGNDETVIWRRRGRLSLPLDATVVAHKMDGVRLAYMVEKVVEALLRIGPVGLIAVEQDGPGGSCADQLKQGKFKEIVKAVHTGRKLKDGKHFNLRAFLHAQAKEYLEDQGPVLPKDSTFKAQATALLWFNRGGMLLIESKEEYRKRLSGATSAVGKMAGRSPDRWDAFVLTFTPTQAKPITMLQVQRQAVGRWRPLDATLGY